MVAKLTDRSVVALTIELSLKSQHIIDVCIQIRVFTAYVFLGFFCGDVIIPLPRVITG